ncbi:MAG: hypothetical protein ACR2PW_00130 [Gammaproteobacteria bacterium]
MVVLWVAALLGALMLLVSAQPLQRAVHCLPAPVMTVTSFTGGIVALLALVIHPAPEISFIPALLLVLLFCSTAIYVGVAGANGPLRVLDLLLRGLVLAFLCFWMYEAQQSGTGKPGVFIHLSLWVVASLAVWLACIQSVFFVVQHYSTKQGWHLSFLGSSSLEQTNRTLTQVSIVACLLTLLAFGYSWWWQYSVKGQSVLLKQYLALATLLLMVALVGSRWWLGWRGHRMVGWLFAAFSTFVLLASWAISLDALADLDTQ